MNNTLRFFLATLLLLVLAAQSAWAIPAFARRNKVSCTTCHAPFPRLTDYGNEFAGNGMIMKESEKERDYITAGDELLWLNKDFPLAVRFDAFGAWEQDATADKDLQTPWGVKLLSGGNLYHNIGYYFYFYMSERGEVAGIEDAYLHFDNVFESPLDIMVGQFQTSDPLMKRELRMTFEDYQIYKTHIGDSGTNLAYDRGVMMIYGVESTGTDIVGFVVNGNGIPEADAARKYDSDKNKNFGLRVSQGLGEHLSVGGYAYFGEEQPANSAFSNEVTYFGPDIGISIANFDLTAQYLVRTDSDPTFVDGAEVETTGICAELVYAPLGDQSRWLLTGLYNQVDSDIVPGPGIDDPNYETWTLSGTYLLARNLRLILEGTRDMERETNRLVFGVISAF